MVAAMATHCAPHLDLKVADSAYEVTWRPHGRRSSMRYVQVFPRGWRRPTRPSRRRSRPHRGRARRCPARGCGHAARPPRRRTRWSCPGRRAGPTPKKRRPRRL
eukprot:2919403-Alexandrium_andersonii.AAC.1